ncbi:VirK/YbjX family protein [Vibrio anguillarum]|uniref:VirK/YbjX family protein n=1 Tax=Vibrio anguillarum TaxID=55601 RepID=A0ABD4QPQ2_VIBAN|nr:VirK/YbjX family protein [Vibrio anguillarum]ASG01243.1 DUF535 domain-containing protein [Vibrio anguillarum]ASG05082.1 DUF535 domain-containing protein [Vibrio anguillarum]MBT2917224.1 VirK/YbjX family protein [Vibrio anguillarum]
MKHCTLFSMSDSPMFEVVLAAEILVHTMIIENKLDYLFSLSELSETIYPNTKGWSKIRKNIRFCLWGVTNAYALKSMLRLFSCSELAEVLKQCPQFLEKPLKPYLCVNWSAKERTWHINQHFIYLVEQFGFNAAKFFSESGFSIFDFYDKNGASYSLSLCSGEIREGSLGLQLTDEKGQKIYSISFNVSDQGRSIYIGSLQGPSSGVSDRNQIIKDLTRTTHGLRTKALMVEMIMTLARILGVENLYAISNRGHMYQALRYIGSKRKSVSFDYDELWTEYEAEKMSKYLYRLPTTPNRKGVETLNRNKRRLYTKRYEWLAEVETAMSGRIEQLKLMPKHFVV